MISYDKLVKILKQNGLKKSDLTKVLGISSRTVAKIGKGEKIADNVLQRIAAYFSKSRPTASWKCESEPKLMISPPISLYLRRMFLSRDGCLPLKS